MPRPPRYPPLRVLLNNRLVGHLAKEPGGAISFRYDAAWLRGGPSIPVSLSLPLRETTYKGEPVVAVFENLLPDSDALRRRVAEKVGARGIDAYSLLAEIGRDCVGALQFLPGSHPDDDADAASRDTTQISGEAVNEAAIERILQNLTQSPLGLDRDDPFRISVAGAQEKTALFLHEGQWLKPHGATPTTHLLKKSLGRLPNGLDLSDSIENEHYCLRLLAAFGLPVANSEIRIFGQTKALVVQRFDRQHTREGRFARLPQEDFCQALSVPPTRKYQTEGGPGMVEILELLKGSDTPAEDQKKFLKAQILYWLIGATDGHAKNFSIFLGPGGRFSLTPFYDVLSIQPNLDARRVHKKHVRLAMCAGQGRYRLDYIRGEHFFQTVERARLPKAIARDALSEIDAAIESAFRTVETNLPPGPSESIHESVKSGVHSRLEALRVV